MNIETLNRIKRISTFTGLPTDLLLAFVTIVCPNQMLKYLKLIKYETFMKLKEQETHT